MSIVRGTRLIGRNKMPRGPLRRPEAARSNCADRRYFARPRLNRRNGLLWPGQRTDLTAADPFDHHAGAAAVRARVVAKASRSLAGRADVLAGAGRTGGGVVARARLDAAPVRARIVAASITCHSALLPPGGAQDDSPWRRNAAAAPQVAADVFLASRTMTSGFR